MAAAMAAPTVPDDMANAVELLRPRLGPEMTRSNELGAKRLCSATEAQVAVAEGDERQHSRPPRRSIGTERDGSNAPGVPLRRTHSISPSLRSRGRSLVSPPVPSSLPTGG